MKCIYRFAVANVGSGYILIRRIHLFVAANVSCLLTMKREGGGEQIRCCKRELYTDSIYIYIYIFAGCRKRELLLYSDYRKGGLGGGGSLLQIAQFSKEQQRAGATLTP